MRVLDTNIVIALLSGRLPLVRQRYEDCVAAGGTISLSVITLFELHFGIEKSARRERNKEILDVFLSEDLAILEFTDNDARIAAAIRAQLQATSQPIGPYDVLIAAQALSRSAVLITGNVREFRRVESLPIEDWTASSP